MCRTRCLERIKGCDKGEGVATSTWAGVVGNVALAWTEKHAQAELDWIVSVRERVRGYVSRRDDAYR